MRLPIGRWQKRLRYEVIATVERLARCWEGRARPMVTSGRVQAVVAVGQTVM